MSGHRPWRTIVRKNTRTDVIASSSTRRKRTRGDAIRDAIRQFDDDVDDALNVFENNVFEKDDIDEGQ